MEVVEVVSLRVEEDFLQVAVDFQVAVVRHHKFQLVLLQHYQRLL
jgi:hypothetical protein